MKKLVFVVCCFCASVCLYAKSALLPIDATWKVFAETAAMSAPPAPSDVPSSAIDYAPGGFLPQQYKGCFWLVAELAVPSGYAAQDLYFETGSVTAAMEVYIDGICLAKHGTITPKLCINHVSNTIVLVPDWAKADGKIAVAIRCKTTMSNAMFSAFSFANEERYYKVITLQNFLNTTVYFMMSAVCLFLGLYFLFQLLANKNDRADLFFSIALLAIAVYFFDIATDILFLPINVQLVLSRFGLPFSVSILTLFMSSFFGCNTKRLNIVVGSTDTVLFILYLCSFKDSVFFETIFTVSLVPIFSCIIYLVVILIRYVKKGDKNAKVLLTGIGIGLLFGMYDFVYQAIGKMPFAWLQGFAFFCMNISMFIVVSMESGRNKRSVSEFASKTTAQKNTLDAIIEKAKNLSVETMNISTALNDSVASVSRAVEESATKASKIGEYITEQNVAVKSTSVALGNLVSSVDSVLHEVQDEAALVDATVTETTTMIDSIDKASKGISNAADFSASLGKITKQSSEDIAKLVAEMESIKNSSAEIIAVVEAVSDFAVRTNMLAMNASIEAAHSGSAGKGFSVIAHEIKKLAEASKMQSEKITDIVTQIDTNILASFELSKNIQVAMDSATKEADTALRSVNDSVQSMLEQKVTGQRIKDTTVLMSKSAGTVKNETEQQGNYAHIASANMNNLSESATTADSAIKEIIGTNQALVTQITALRDVASRAKDTAAELDKLIRG